MATSRKVEDTLSLLTALSGADADALIRQLPHFLTSPSNLIVAKAAKLAGNPAVSAALEPELLKAFSRFCAKAGSADRGCAAKFAIANTLYESACVSPGLVDLFLTGARWTHREPVYGGTSDTAVELRGICGMGLVRVGYPRVMELLVDLLADLSPQTRLLAIRALGYAGQDTGALLLRHKILTGDGDERVIPEAIAVLGQLSGIKALDFLARLLDSPGNEQRYSAVAMAIGEMRHAEALAVLQTAWRENMHAAARAPLLLPMALSRLPAAIEFLLQVIHQSPVELAGDAAEALAIFKHDPQMRAKVSAAVMAREEAAVCNRFDRAFG